MKSLNFLLPDRKDFLGANFVTKLGAFIYAKERELKVYYTPKFPFYESMYMKIFLNEGKPLEKKMKFENLGCDHRKNQIIPVISLKQDMVSFFSEKYKEKYFNVAKTIADERKYILPWGDNSKIICFHLRLYDDRNHNGSNYHDYDGSGSADYIKEMVENGEYNYDMKKMDQYCKKRGIDWGVLKHSDKQCAMGVEKFEKMILKMREEYPFLIIHVITKLNKDSNNKQYIDICKKYNIEIHSNDDWDYDLWLMINSEVLILSKSTYSQIAGYFHQGSKVIYPLWGTGVSNGIYTKYDKSGWEYYI